MLFTGQGLLIIAVFALLLFGPDKLPEIARVVGKFMAEFKRAQAAMEQTIKAEMYTQQAVTPVTPDAACATAGVPAEEAAASLGAATASYVDVDEDEEEEE